MTRLQLLSGFAALLFSGGCGADSHAPPAETGVLVIRTSTSGTRLDPDGYLLSLDGTAGRAIGINDSLILSEVAAGAHAAELFDFAPGCEADPARRDFEVAAADTAQIYFGVLCPSGYDQLPAWSPDGARIAFLSNRYRTYLTDEAYDEIYVMAADGSNVTRLTFTGVPDASHGRPGWSPDGSRIIFSRHTLAIRPPAPRTNNDLLHVMNADGSDLHPVAPDVPAREPAWSPDGTRIAFFGIPDILTMGLDGSAIVSITPDSLTGAYSPAWSPDGSRLAFVVERGHLHMPDVTALYAIDADGANVELLTQEFAMASYAHPSWSPDGSAVAYSCAALREPCSGCSVRYRSAYDICVRLVGGPLLAQAIDGGEDWGPSWSPDGTQIAFTSHRDGEPEIYVMNADASNQRRLTR